LAQVALIRPGAAGRTGPVEAPKRAGDKKVNQIEHRVRERAYRIWLDEGRPEGRAELHWEMASELVAIEENSHLALQPNPLRRGEEALVREEPVEPVELMDNLGEFPTLTDQGEEQSVPKRAPRKSATATAGGETPAKAVPKRTAAKASVKDATTAAKPSAGKRGKPAP
jgi:hypothetical protein